MASSDIQFDLEVQTASPAHVQIGRHIRRMIEKGEIAPGARLPTNPELARRIGVSPTAVHRALYKLSADGLLDRQPGRGTFVRTKTDLAIIGLLFGARLSDESAHFHRAMLRALDDQLTERQWMGRQYSGFRSLDRTPEFEAKAYTQLARDCKQYRFSGLIAVSVRPVDLDAIPELKSIPRASYHIFEERGDIHFNHVFFLRQSLEWLAQRGRRRVFYLSVRPNDPVQFEAEGDKAFFGTLRKLGLTRLQKRPFIPADYGYRDREIHKACMELFRQWERMPDKDRPDALIVDDDIAMRSVALALIQSDISVPDDLLIVSEANEQANFHYGIPVARYEISTREIAVTLVDLLWRRMAGEALPPLPIEIMGKIKEE